MTQTPSLAQLLKHAIDNRLLDVHTALIGRVERYDAGMQLIDIQPILKAPIKNAEDEFDQKDLPLLMNYIPLSRLS